MVARRIRIGDTSAAATTWDTTATSGSANVTFSGGNQTVTSTGSGYAYSTTTRGPTGKLYFELLYGGTGMNTSSDWYAGLVDTAGAFPANFNYAQATIWWVAGGTSVGACNPVPSAGDIACVAVDFDNSRIWIRNNGGATNWNFDPSANPATNTGGANFSTSITNGLFRFVVTLANSGSSATMVPGPSFTYTKPSGFTGWDP